MNALDEDMNESDLFCKSHIQKKKVVENTKSKQLKLNFNQVSNKVHKEQAKIDCNSPGGNLNRNKVQDWNSTCNESHSSYFSTKKSINTCPLCLKAFKTDSMYSIHMKQCAKTHKMTTQQLLGALELQKKQMQERKNLGLSSQILISEKKSASKKRFGKDQDSYDLALGLALSKSLTANESRTAILPETSKSTLKEFGFTSSSATTSATGPSKRKNYGDKKTLLRERLPEDRQRIIIEKVAVVLLDEDKVQSTENGMQKQNCSYQNGQVSQLWSKGENNCNSGWYVHGIKKFVLLNENEIKESVPDNIENEIEKLNLPQKNISNDWRKIINDKTFSDFVGKTKDDQDVYLHSVVLYARSPELLEKDCKSIFEKFNLSTILIFIEYIYCGTLNGLLTGEIDNLFNLAKEFDYNELTEIISCLKSNLSGGCTDISKELPDIKHKEKTLDITVIQTDKMEVLQDENLSPKEALTVSIPNGSESDVEGNGDSSNTEKSYWSFMQHEKKMGKGEEFGSLENEEASINTQYEGKKANLRSPAEPDKINKLRRPSDDSTTRDWDDLFTDKKAKTFSDCIIISSGSDTNCEENFIKSQGNCSRTPSPIDVNHEAPLYDPYDNFYCTTEEPFSPVGLHSQSLITGDISMESPKECSTAFQHVQEESYKTVGYCSTPVTVRRSSETDTSIKHSLSKKSKRKQCDPSSSRLLRKSLGIRQKRNFKSTSSRKNRKAKKSLAEVLTNSVLNELSGSSAFDSCPLTEKDFIEITPVSNRDEFADSVTPSPNYSNMGEALLKEQLGRYGLKKSLAKSKAKKILRLIYDELHPLYNTKTGKIVKMLPGNTSKGEKKSKPTGKLKADKKGKPNLSKKNLSGEKIKTCLNSSKETENLSGGSIISLDRSTTNSSEESDFESLNEPLTQSLPTNPIDLPSAFCEFLQNCPEYHQKILLYEPIWLEDLQKKLKEDFNKHFKMSDLMDFLDQKCIAFRSIAQAKKLQKRYEARKDNSRKKNTPSKENSN